MVDFQFEIPDRLNFLSAWCHSNQTENEQLRQDVCYLSAKCESLEQKCAQMEDWQRYLHDMTNHLHDHQDQLEHVTRQNNVRLFNVQEEPRGDNQSCVKTVVQLLNRFYPIKSWAEQDIIRAHRVGKPSRDGHPRTILVQLATQSDKLSILQEKSHRREMADWCGVRVAGDLTIRQQSEKKRHSVNGKVVYFRSGRLHFRQGRSSPRQWRRYPTEGKKGTTTSDDWPENPNMASQHKTKTSNSALQASLPPVSHTDQPPRPFPIVPPSPSNMAEYPPLTDRRERRTTLPTHTKRNANIIEGENMNATTLFSLRQVPPLQTEEEMLGDKTGKQMMCRASSTLLKENSAPVNREPGISLPPPVLSAPDLLAPPANFPSMNQPIPVGSEDFSEPDHMNSPNFCPKNGSYQNSIHRLPREGRPEQVFKSNTNTPPRMLPAFTQSTPMDTPATDRRKDVPVNETNMYTPPVESLDDSETLVKQPFDMCSPVHDVENQPQGMEAGSPLQCNTPVNVSVSTPVTEQHVTLEHEGISLVPGAGLCTRSKVKRRQMQITDSFTCTMVNNAPDLADNRPQRNDLQAPDDIESGHPHRKPKARSLKGKGNNTAKQKTNTKT
ncbi:hypothetical protein ACOMHN_046294 [Nucella lapillus]